MGLHRLVVLLEVVDLVAGINRPVAVILVIVLILPPSSLQVEVAGAPTTSLQTDAVMLPSDSKTLPLL